MPGPRLQRAEAVTYPAKTDLEFDAVFSAFGAVRFTDPHVLLPVVRKRLRPRRRVRVLPPTGRGPALPAAPVGDPGFFIS
ncbi:hypothetical protein [Streptomyces wuyuanensis]|uniref:hypothetical protein n=1 Tax=Streptomyces wuyuanensis TaxID=1196353 RepID=UPI0036C769CF